MSTALRQIRQAIEQLNPAEVRQSADYPVRVHLVAWSEAGYSALEEFLAPRSVTAAKRAAILRAFARDDSRADLEIVQAGLQVPDGAFVFEPSAPDRMIQAVLSARQDLGLSLARTFPAFRPAVASKIVYTVSRENALFALVTAMPALLPGLQLPWAIPEAASDTAVLTVNQIRMAFLLAGASDRAVGYREQKAEIGSIIAGAFGWRAIARELAARIPLGGGLLPKAAIAFAGTFVEGLSLERLYRLGYAYTREERHAAYGEALERGKQVAALLWERLGRRRPE